jgi:hypothetical protein
MSNFEVGDWVLVISNHRSGLDNSCIGTLMQITTKSSVIRNTFIYNLKYKGDKIAYRCAFHEELAEPTELIKALV